MPQAVRARARPYDPAADHPAVVDMCRDVCELGFAARAAMDAAPPPLPSPPPQALHQTSPPALAADGGTDPLPQYLAAQMAEPGTRVWVAQREGRAAPESLICCQPRGDALWVWGARTLAAARGCGLGALLLVGVGHDRRGGRSVLKATRAAGNAGLAHARNMCRRCWAAALLCSPFRTWATAHGFHPPSRPQQAHTEAAGRRQYPALRWLLSTTILANPAMMRLFERQGWRTLCEVDIFPRWAAPAGITGIQLSACQCAGVCLCCMRVPCPRRLALPTPLPLQVLLPPCPQDALLTIFCCCNLYCMQAGGCAGGHPAAGAAAGAAARAAGRPAPSFRCAPAGGSGCGTWPAPSLAGQQACLSGACCTCSEHGPCVWGPSLPLDVAHQPCWHSAALAAGWSLNVRSPCPVGA